MTKIEELHDESARTQAKARYVDALFLGLNREPQSYEYRGEIVDMGNEGRCVCGHPIKNGFVLHRKAQVGCLCHAPRSTDIKIVGSTCVEHFAFINAELYAALLNGVAELNRRIAEAKKAAKAAQNQAEVNTLAERWEALYEAGKAEYRRYKDAGRMAPRGLWQAYGSYYGFPSHAPEYMRAADYKRWYKQQIAMLEKLLAQHNILLEVSA